MSNKKIFASGLLWKLFERFSVQAGRFIVQLFLARLLLPEEYGIVAVMMVFVSFADIIVQSGLSASLIQKKDVDELDFSTMLFAGWLLALFMYGLLWIASVHISQWYGIAQLKNLIRILSLNLFIGAVYSVEIAYISRELQFKYNFYSTLSAIIISGIISIHMAMVGYGVWSMVIQQIIFQLVTTVFLGYFIGKKITLRFSIYRLKNLFSFGWKIMISGMIANLTENFYNIFLGKEFGSQIVGYYNRGHQFPLVLCSSINNTIESYFFPLISSKQHSIQDVKELARSGVRFCSYLTYPLIVGLFLVADSLVDILLTSKWSQCVPFLRIECLFYLTLPTLYIHCQVVKALGKGCLLVVLEFVKATSIIVGIWLFFDSGAYTVVSIKAIVSFGMVLIQLYVSKVLIGYTVREHILDIREPILFCLVMSVFVSLVPLMSLNSLGTLVYQIVLGILIYIMLSIVFKNSVFMTIVYKILKSGER